MNTLFQKQNTFSSDLDLLKIDFPVALMDLNAKNRGLASSVTEARRQVLIAHIDQVALTLNEMRQALTTVDKEPS